MGRWVLVFFCFFFTLIPSRAQKYGNEWYDASKAHVRIGISENGLYRIDFFVLDYVFRQAGVSIRLLEASKLQLWSRGAQVPMTVSDQGDNRIGPGDFLEFFALKADGSLDSELYVQPGMQPHQKGTLISDTAYYFITWSETGPWLRYTPYRNYKWNTVSTASWHLRDEWKTEQQLYHRGKPARVSDRDFYPSEYNDAEGWGSNPVGYGISGSMPEFVSAFNTAAYEPSGPNPELSYYIAGITNFYNLPDHRLRVTAGNGTAERQLKDTITYGFAPIRQKATLQPSDMGGLVTQLRLKPIAMPNIPYARYQVFYTRLKFPKKNELDGASAYTFQTDSSAAPRLYQWSGYSNGSRTRPMLFNPTNGLRIGGDFLGGGNFRLIMPANSHGSDWHLWDSLNFRWVSIHPDSMYHPVLAELPDFSTHIDQSEYIIISHAGLMGDELNDYLNYRQGRYAARIVSTEQLYNAFSYGQAHPIAIRRYAAYLLERSKANPPKFIFLVGRGYETIYLKNSKQYQKLNLVPSIGVPASDHLYTAGLNGTTFEPAIPIGRLPAEQKSEIRTYLNKIIAFESSGYASWQKEILHMGGGSSNVQAQDIRGMLEALEPYPEQGILGGKVTGYYKASTGAQSVGVKQSIISALNSGLNLITFLGHGSTQVTDIDMGDTADYSNQGKYPICYFNGCQIGNPCVPYGNRWVFSERMVKAGRRGAIAFIAQTSISELFSVNRQMGDFYRAMFDKAYGKTIGEIIQTCIRNYQDPNSFLNRIHCQQLFLIGDPAIKSHAPEVPDYSVNERSIFLDPPNTFALSDSFRVAIIVTNNGRKGTDSINIGLRRIYPDGITRNDYQTRIAPFGYKDTAYITIRSKDISTKGSNVFEAEVNPDRTVTEFTYTNNRTSSLRYIPGNGVNLLYPRRFAIVGNDTVNLVFQPADLTVSNDQFFAELDTTPRFNSPWVKRSGAFNSEPLVQWKVHLDPKADTVVYYWRARINAGSAEGGRWSTHSFTYIKNHSSGWMQQSGFQYSNVVSANTFQNLRVDTLARQLRFGPLMKKLYVDAEYANRSNKGVKEGGFGGQDRNAANCVNGFVCMVFDPNKNELTPLDTAKIKPMCSGGMRWKLFGYPANEQIYYSFRPNVSAERDAFVSFVDLVPDSFYVALFTSSFSSADQWTPQVLQALNKLGCTVMDDPANRTSTAIYVAVGKKGWSPGKAFEDVAIFNGVPGSGYASIEAELYGTASSGSMNSEYVGPAGSWGSLHLWRKDRSNASETATVSVLGRAKDGSEQVLIPSVSGNFSDLSSIDARQYPYLRLKAAFSDPSDFSSMQLPNWRILFSEVPEGTLYPVPRLGYEYYRDSLYRGDSLRLFIPFSNISALPFADSIMATAHIFKKEDRSTVMRDTTFLPAAKPGETYVYRVRQDTRNLIGAYQAIIQFNPAFRQEEFSLSNNSNTFSFEVVADRQNPLLDVTFDGRRIFNGDIVRAEPLIRISNKDENKYLLQTDSSRFNLFLKRPGSPDYTPVPVDGTEAVFKPAQTAGNSAVIDYRPRNLPDGTYSLKVQAADMSGNPAGEEAYVVDFRVVNKNMVTNFYPYPNPFSTQMRFVFTLTGNDIPDEVHIKIMTADGRVVKHVHQDELGPMHIGNNISQWSWDGTDQFGDRLANGVYFYQVTVRKDGKKLEHFESAGDASFKQQVGKIYLLR